MKYWLEVRFNTFLVMAFREVIRSWGVPLMPALRNHYYTLAASKTVFPFEAPTYLMEALLLLNIHSWHLVTSKEIDLC
jgi:hypothetical protein